MKVINKNIEYFEVGDIIDITETKIIKNRYNEVVGNRKLIGLVVEAHTDDNLDPLYKVLVKIIDFMVIDFRGLPLSNEMKYLSHVNIDLISVPIDDNIDNGW